MKGQVMMYETMRYLCQITFVSAIAVTLWIGVVYP